MEKKYGSATFLNSIKDTFPYIESAIMIMDNNFNWWKSNYELLEGKIANEARGVADSPVKISTRFIIYSGPDENVDAVKWSGPAMEFSFVEDPLIADKVKKSIGNLWEGHKVLTEDNKLIIMFE